MTTAYPLSWPESMPRAGRREKGAFKTTLAGALKNVQDSLRLFGRDSGKPVTGIVLSSNVTLGADRPGDPGVAVWFTWEGKQYCIPVDRYETPAANLQAIHHVLEARRVELRHGTLALVRATFAGFRSLPAPAATRNWRDIIGVAADVRNMPDVRIAYRRRASEAHPDKGGSHEAMTELNAALAAAEKELNG
ncbi:molecular chaperone DnaJ [Burkholderia sp. ST111]|nr:molecular chaperone DnaJ [Burkholderia sp. ST111]